MKLEPISRTNRPKRKEVVMPEDAAAALIEDGDVVIVGGFGTVNHPMPIIRALIRRKVKNLTVIGAATAGLEIPPGLQSGERITLRGHGVPRLRGGTRGDLVVEVLVETPGNLDDAQRELLRQLAEARNETAPEARLGRTQRSVFGRIRDALR